MESYTAGRVEAAKGQVAKQFPFEAPIFMLLLFRTIVGPLQFPAVRGSM